MSLEIHILLNPMSMNDLSFPFSGDFMPDKQDPLLQIGGAGGCGGGEGV